MKKILLAIVCALVAIVAFAQEKPDSSGGGQAAVTVQHEGKSVTLTADSATMQISVEKSVEVAEGAPKAFTADNGESFVIYNGKAYEVASVVRTLDKMSDNIAGIRADLRTSQSGRRNRLIEMLIVFGIPCLTIGVALVFLLVFLIRKNTTRTEIICRAIENNYELPEAFYTGQSSAINTDCGYGAPAEASSQSGAGFLGMRPVPLSMRDPRAFSSAMTTTAVGFALLLFFGLTARWGIAFLVGGIPFFIGIGKLVSYFFVPAPARNRGSVPPQYNGQYPGQYPPQQPPFGHTPGQPYAGDAPGARSSYAQPNNEPRPNGQPTPPPFPGEHTSDR